MKRRRSPASPSPNDAQGRGPQPKGRPHLSLPRPAEESWFAERLHELAHPGSAPRSAPFVPDHEAHHLEDRLASLLRRERLVPFERRARIGRFEVDFLFARERLVVELDGFVHLASSVREKDRVKDHFLTSLGYRVIHVENQELRAAPDQVAHRIRAAFAKPGGRSHS